MENQSKKYKAGIDYVGITTSFYCHDGEGNFVFALRNKNCRDEHGKWDPGAGSLDHGLTLEENVLKEVLEEYGCAGTIEKWLPPISIFRTNEVGEKTHWLAIGAFVRVNKDDVMIMEKEKFDDLIWKPLNDLPQPIHSGFEYHFQEQNELFREYFPKEK